MSHKMQLSDCHSGKDFQRYVQHDTRVKDIRQTGSHVIVETEIGSAVFPCHAKDLGTGILHKIVKAFIAIGLGVFLIFCLMSGAMASAMGALP